MNATQILKTLEFPIPNQSVLSVWRRNFIYFRRSLAIAAVWIFIEPLLALVAFGYGMGSFLGPIGGRSYLSFFFPALMATSAMLVSYFEATYGSYTKLTQSRTFSSIITSPITPEELALGEILWAASKGLIGAIGVGLVGVALGLFSMPSLLAMLLVIAVQGLLFGSIGLLMTGYARNYDWFTYAQTGLIVPMSLFCGTYFPMSYWPDALAKVFWCLPLSHSVALVRGLAYGQFSALHLIHIIYLVFISVILVNFASQRMRQKLIN